MWRNIERNTCGVAWRGGGVQARRRRGITRGTEEVTKQKHTQAYRRMESNSMIGNDGVICGTAEGDHERREAERWGGHSGHAARKESIPSPAEHQSS